VNILITGDLSSLATTVAKEFAKEDNRIVLACDNTKDLDVDIKNIIVHSINPTEYVFRDALSSYKFDVMIFIPKREEQLGDDEKFDGGLQLDRLRSTLELGKKENVKHFFYISSTEVYGNMTDESENIDPVPATINGHTLLTGENYCKLYQYEFGLNVSILRLPYIYSPDEKTGYIYKLIQDCKNQNEVLIPGSANQACNFLHSSDVANFLRLVVDDEYSPSTLVVNLSSTKTVTNSNIAELFNKYFPDVIINFDNEKKVYTRPAALLTAKKIFGWSDLYDLNIELDNYEDLISGVSPAKRVRLRGVFNKFSNYSEILKWVELILGAGLTQFLSQLTGTLIQYKYVDFRLLFVVLMGSIYGLRFGVLSSILVILSLIYTWYQLGIDWSLLFYNVGNWFPIALYFATGIIAGYTHDRTETIIDNKEKETKLIYEKYEFLYEVFNEVRKLKDEFREQVIGYRDSFGKIYTVTQELDTLQEHAVYFRALTILEDLMDNNSITIYSLEPDRVYARLEVNSRSLSDKLAKSLKLSDYSDAMKCIEQGIIYKNTSLLPNYPAYIAPVLNNEYPFNVPVAIIVIWSVKFEQYSTYYYNLFKVISGLIQASLVRATKFLDANYEKMYIPATRILNPDAFIEILKTRSEMKKNKIADYQLVMLEKNEMDIHQLDSKVNEGIRGADIVGMQRDGSYYILLTQADKLAAKDVIARFEKLGLKGRLVDGHDVLLG
jgi:nucleoside-diphosphate-sugar epimerase